MDTKEKDDKKIAIGKNGKKSQIILNPPEVTTPVPFKEIFLKAVHKHRVTIDEKTKIVLNVKASQCAIPVSVIEQVYTRGIKSLPLNSNLTREQHAMNRVNSFLSGGAAMREDIDLIPIHERLVTKQLKGTGGGARPHIKREKSPYNNKILYHVVDAKGRIKHTTSDEMAARLHLVQKYQSYLEGVENPAKRFEGTKSLVKRYKDDTPGEKDIKEEGKGLWANIHAKRERIKRGSGERMRKPGSEGAPTAADLKRSAVKEEVNIVEYGDTAAQRFRRANPDEPDEPSYSQKRYSSYRAPEKQEPHAVHINGKKWKTFGSQRHAQNVANKIKGATVHKEEYEIEEESNQEVASTYKRIAVQHLKDMMSKDASNSSKIYAKKMHQRALEASKMSNHTDALNHYRGMKEEVEGVAEARKFGYDAINARFKKQTGQSLEDRAKHYAATSERLKKMQADYEAQGIIKKKDEGQGK